MRRNGVGTGEDVGLVGAVLQQPFGGVGGGVDGVGERCAQIVEIGRGEIRRRARASLR